MIKNFSILNNDGDVKSVLNQKVNFEGTLTRLTHITKGTKSRAVSRATRSSLN